MWDHETADVAVVRAPRSKWHGYYKLLFTRGFNAYKRNKLNRDKIKNWMDHANYEAIVQTAGIDDDDLLYYSYTNKVTLRVSRFKVEG